jgi:hypothetical protein
MCSGRFFVNRKVLLLELQVLPTTRLSHANPEVVYANQDANKE